MIKSKSPKNLTAMEKKSFKKKRDYNNW